MEQSLSLRINNAARFLCAPDWSWDTGQGFADNDLWVVTGGSGELKAPAAVYPLERGDTFLLQPRTRYVARHDPAHPLSVIAVHFLLSEPSAYPLHRRLVPVEFLAGILDRLLSARLQSDSASALFWMRAALIEIGDADTRSDPGASVPAVRALINQIRDRPGDKWDLATLASRLSLSRQHVARLFKAETGYSPGAFLMRTRIEAAQAYLRGSSLPLKRIATLTGFHDEFHFSNQFFRQTGMRPSSYRRRG